VVLINTIGLTEFVSDSLGSRKQKETSTNSKIVHLLKHALDETKATCDLDTFGSTNLGRFLVICVKKKFELQVRKWEEYKGTRYSDGDSALVVELWLHRVADDLSGLTFQEWDPSAGSDDTSVPVSMIVNSIEFRSTDFPLSEVTPLQPDVVALGGRRTNDVVVRKLQGVGNSTFVPSVEKYNDFRSRCE
jgi:hypothetical protein